MIYCTCRSRDYEYQWYEGSGPSSNGGNELQVHPTCSKPHREYTRKLTGMLAPHGAVALIGVFGRRDGINEITFALQSGEKEMVEVLSTQPTAVHEMWEMLDDAMDHIIDTQERDALPLWKARARTLAQCISLCMPKHYPTPDDVAREAMLRYESGDPEGRVTRQTPGLADQELVQNKPPALQHKLDDAQVKFIKTAHETIPIPELARMFKVSEAVINSLL